MILHRTTGRIVVLLVLGAIVAAFSFGLRATRQDADLIYESINDANYYAAMSERPFEGPMTLEAERALVSQPSTLEETIPRLYDDEPLHSDYLHRVNGLSHQAPFAQRVLVPYTAAVLVAAGVDVVWAYQIIFLIAIVAIFLLAYRVVAGSFELRIPHLLLAGSTAMAASLVNLPAYVDAPACALLLAGVLAARSERVGWFVPVALAAGLCRETGVVLSLVWLLRVRTSGGRLLSARSLPALAPAIGVGLPRLLVEVPDASIDYAGIFELTGNVPWFLWASAATAVIALAVPIRSDSDDRRFRLGLLVIGVLFALGPAMIASGVARLVFNTFPLLLAAGDWRRARTRDVVPWVVAMTLYPLADTAQSAMPTVAALVTGWAVLASMVLVTRMITGRRRRVRVAA